MSWLRIELDVFNETVMGLPTRCRLNGQSVLLEMLKRARREAGFINGLPLERGQLVYGESELAKACFISRQEVRTIKKHFKRQQILTIKSTHSGSVATLLNYSDLAIDAKHKQPTNQPTSNQPSTTNTVVTVGTVPNNKYNNGSTEELVPTQGQEIPRSDLLRLITNQIGFMPPFLPSRDLERWKYILALAKNAEPLIKKALDNYNALKACREARGAWPFVLTVIRNSVEQDVAIQTQVTRNDKDRREKMQSWKEALEPDYGKTINHPTPQEAQR